MAANNSTGNDGESSPLLALPIELLQRISGELTDETLTTFRLTCKTVEAVTFDRFAEIFFEERYCCIYHKPRWTLLKDVVSSRMGDRIRRVIFTTDSLAPAQIEHLQLAPVDPGEEGYFILRDQDKVGDDLADAAGTRTQTIAWPSKAAIERCLRCIRTLAPNAHIETNLNGRFQHMWEKSTSVKANVLLAIAAYKMKLTAFSTSSCGIVEVNDAVAMETLGRYDLSSYMHSVQSFSYEETPFDKKYRCLVYQCLKSATELRDVRLMFYTPAKQLAGPTVSKILSISDVSRLETLDFTELFIEGADLTAVLSRCRSTLRSVAMDQVRVWGSDSAWQEAFGTLASMPHLSKVRLTWLQHTPDSILRYNLDDGFGPVTCEWTVNEGRGQLNAGLSRLLATMPKVVN